jgi:hypothetical protein
MTPPFSENGIDRPYHNGVRKLNQAVADIQTWAEEALKFRATPPRPLTFQPAGIAF